MMVSNAVQRSFSEHNVDRSIAACCTGWRNAFQGLGFLLLLLQQTTANAVTLVTIDRRDSLTIGQQTFK